MEKVIRVRVLGAECAQCEVLYADVAQVARELGLKIELKRIGDLRAVLGHDILARPVLLIEGTLATAGYLPSLEQLRTILAGYVP